MNFKIIFKRFLSLIVFTIIFLPISVKTANALEIPSANAKNAEKIVYGRSGKNRNLTAYKLGNGSNIMFAIFEQHGYEDGWNKDGLELVKMGNYLTEHLSNYNLTNWTIYIIPSANPDGLTDGWTNNGPGRCTVTTKMDMNRSFPTGFYFINSARNYTGKRSLSAPESKNLYNFILGKRNPSSVNILIDIHGWEGSTIGNREIGKYFNKQFNTYHKSSYGRGYLTAWSNSIGIKSAIVELPNPYSSKNIVKNNYSGKIYNAVTNIINAYRTKSSKKYGTVTAGTLNVRSGAGTNYSIIGQLHKDNTVEIISTSNGWYNIVYKNRKAYVSSRYINQ